MFIVKLAAWLYVVPTIIGLVVTIIIGILYTFVMLSDKKDKERVKNEMEKNTTRIDENRNNSRE